ncbi:glycosyltransferase family 39 protein [Hymenobacter sp. BT664]|uniref:Glycosyltransferase family 39 protein n=1 Tax=Hymenobacter montanus TaxID=2771359 RepID=A0A927BCT6_9BACT|nr:glycosyltransferase family 39 protein [Hymenobacter montanus]MBD2767702.1 glycosyltransferase family 39 protein [Hymenobacter montanus]
MNVSYPQPARHWLWLLLLILGVGLGAQLNGWGVVETSEARYAEIGREMLASGDWIHPRLLGIQHFHKPPLTYWLTAVGLALGGPRAGAVRLLAVLAVLAQVALVYGLGKLLFAGDRARALAAAVVYGTLPVVLISALNLTTDAYLATLELAATYAVLRYYAEHRPRWLYLGWLAAGLAFLTKGPVGLVLPLLAVAGCFFGQERTRRPFTRHHAWGAVLFVVVGLGWYGYLVAENPAFVRYFLFEHTVRRFANPEAFGRSQPWWFYCVLVPATSLPWSAALLGRAGRTPWATLPRAWRNVLVLWVLVPLVFFSFSSSKLLLYVLPVFPGVALLVVYYLSECTEGALRRWYLGVGGFLVLLLGALAVLPAVTAWPLPVVVGPMVTVWALAGLGVLGLQHWFWRPGGAAPRLLVVAVISTFFLLLAAKTVLSQNELRINSTRPLAERLKLPDLAGRQVVVYDELLPSLAFELGQVPVSLFNGNLNLSRETQFESDSSWQQQLINLRANPPKGEPLSARWWRPVLVIKSPSGPPDQWIHEGLSQREQIGPWWLYYDP